MNKTLLFLTCVCLSFSQIQGADSDRAPMCIKKNGEWKLNLSVMAPKGLSKKDYRILNIENKADFSKRCEELSEDEKNIFRSEELSGDEKNIFRKTGQIPVPATCPESRPRKSSRWNIDALHRTNFSLEAIKKYNNQEGNTYKGDACRNPRPIDIQ